MTLQQLKYVIAVADTGTLTKAAKQLFISQPSLTNSIHALEKEMNIEIFRRTNKGIVISKEGEEFLGYARQVLEQSQSIKKEYGLKTDSAAISFLLQSGNISENIAKAVVNEMEESYMKSERLKWATKTAEQNSTVLLDAINTLLHMMKADTLISVEFAPHPIIQKSKQNIKDKIAHFKQQSDERKRKK